VHRYNEKRDKEIAGFLASQFAYGKIDLFKKFLTAVFERMGSDLGMFIQEGNFSGFDGLYYRFQKSEDIIDLFNVLKMIIDEFSSIGKMIEYFYHGDTREALWKVREHFLGNSNKLTFFFPKPLKSNPLKRWNLYFRWMVRKDEVDAGLWDFIDKKNLIIPLDTHLFKIGRCPLKYDLFLCHRVGIGAECTGKKTVGCKKKCIIY